MANLNKVMLIGRLTRDPESRTFANGGKVTKFGFAVTNRKKNSQTGQWEDEPMFLDCEVFNRGENGTLATLVEERCRKGSQIFVEGRLHLDSWDDKASGQKRTKHKLVVEVVQLLDGRPDGQGGPSGGGMSSNPRSATAANSGGSRSSGNSNYDGGGFSEEPAGNDDIPF